MHFALLTLLTFGSQLLMAQPTLTPCPNSPNCVSSMMTDEHFIEPFKLNAERSVSMEQLAHALKEIEPRIQIQYDEASLSAQVTSFFFRFVDDVDLIYDAQHQRVHVRSASRLGYYDFGVNRRRIEQWRQALQQKGFIQ